MSALGGSRDRPAVIWYISAVVIALLIAGLAYVTLVKREQANAERAQEATEQLEEQISRAREYLNRHQNDAELKKKVDQVTADVKRRIPYGPIDVTVGSYIDAEARKANIEDLRWSVQGGIKPPSPPPKAEEDRLMLDPAKLNSSTVDVTFTARYKDVLKFIQSLSVEKDAAPWPIEIRSLELKRVTNMDGSSAQGKVSVKLVARYFYQ